MLNVWRSEFFDLYNDSTDDNEHVDDSIKRRMLNDSIYLRELVMKDPLYESDVYLNAPITIREVRDVVQKAKLRKAVGTDNIPNEVLKNETLIAILQKLFQLIFDTGKVPSDWIKAMIKPIPKSSESDPRIPLNYRGISLLSCVGKLYTSMLNRRVSKFLNETNRLVDEQNGFRENRSCSDHIFTLHCITKDRQSRGKSTFITFIDFAKAFDSLDRQMMLYKMLQSGIEGDIYYTIKSRYENTISSVLLNKKQTDWFDTKLGVRQGDTISPTLFSIFINDLATGIKSLNRGVTWGNLDISILMYADDIAILSETPVDLQIILDYVSEWCEMWKMKLNMGKTKIIEFRRKGVEKSLAKFYLAGNLVEKCNSYKYLGITFDEFLEFKQNEEILTASGQRALGALISKFKVLNDMGYETYTKCFEASVCPVIDYGSEIWGYIKSKKKDSVQHKAIRVFLGVNKFAAIPFLEGDIGWVPTIIRQKIRMLRFWNRLLKLEPSRLTKKIFLLEYEKKGSWCKEIENILKGIHLEAYYINKSLVNLEECQTKLIIKF